MKFVTTKADYEAAVADVMAGGRKVSCCLLAKTIQRTTGLPYRVGEVSCWVVHSPEDIPLPENACLAISAFDRALATARREGRALHENEGFTAVEFEIPDFQLLKG